MRSYLVGGAVRDALLGRPVTDRDHVVVGARAEQLLALGFRAVGKDFPVFLHPKTSEEYALARTERKSGPGYRGFEVHAAPEVTLEEDLARRDLTINAIARDEQGRLIDPYGGIDDLNQRILRHVSPAFVEDPVRLLRLARFAARLAPLGFKVAPQTMMLLQTMVAAGEVDHLVPERVWAETRKALGEAQPSAFFAVLRQAGALPRLFPELAARTAADCNSAIQPFDLIDTAASLTDGDDLIAYAVLSHDLDAAALQALSNRLRVPNEYASLAESVRRQHRQVREAARLSPAALLALLETQDSLRRPERLQRFLTACRCLRPDPAAPYPQAELLQQAAAAARSISAASFVAQNLQGPAIGAAMREAQLAAITTLLGK